MARFIYSPFTPIADRWQFSHRAGWALYWAQELRAKVVTSGSMESLREVNKTDEVYVYHGMEFKDALNFPGGPPEPTRRRAMLLEDLRKFLGPNLISIDRKMPDYASLLAKHGIQSTFRHENCSWMHYPSTAPRRIIVGDSHALSLYAARGTVISRNDHQTLYGLMEDPTKLDPFLKLYAGTTNATFYFGNIDVRHHLCRPGAQPPDVLAKRYLDWVSEVRRRFQLEKVSVTVLLPLEPESRVIPKSGWYKGTPFYGSWQDRDAVRSRFNVALARLAPSMRITLDYHPDYWQLTGGVLDEAVMEKPRSVHIAPQHYRLIEEGEKWSGV